MARDMDIGSIIAHLIMTLSLLAPTRHQVWDFHKIRKIINVFLMVTIVLILVEYVNISFLPALMIGFAAYFIINILFDPKGMLHTYYLNVLSIIAVIYTTFRGHGNFVLHFLKASSKNITLHD